jgi:GTP-binding protein HflX
VLADTVGFVRDLPHELVAAFKSTLQEAREADLILHLIDASDQNRWQRVRQVNAVLKQLDADHVPQIRVYNKIDKLDRKPRMTNNRHGEGRAVWLSAVSGEGLPMLRDAIAKRLRQKMISRTIHLQPTQGRQRAKLFELGAVLKEDVSEDGSWTLDLRMSEKDLRRFLKRENLDPEQMEPAQESTQAAKQQTDKKQTKYG